MTPIPYLLDGAIHHCHTHIVLNTCAACYMNCNSFDAISSVYCRHLHSYTNKMYMCSLVMLHSTSFSELGSSILTYFIQPSQDYMYSLTGMRVIRRIARYQAHIQCSELSTLCKHNVYYRTQSKH